MVFDHFNETLVLYDESSISVYEGNQLLHNSKLSKNLGEVFQINSFFGNILLVTEQFECVSYSEQSLGILKLLIDSLESDLGYFVHKNDNLNLDINILSSLFVIFLQIDIFLYDIG